MISPVAICADVHVGNHQVLGGRYEAGLNERCLEVLRALGLAVAEANRQGAHDFVVAGDLFDTARPSPQMVAAVMRVLLAFGGRVHLLRGNHDMVSEQPDDSALAPFRNLARVTVWERPGWFALPDGGVVGMVPFQSGEAASWLPAAVQAAFEDLDVKANLPRALVLHLGLRTSAHRQAGPWMKDAHDAVDVELLGELCCRHGVQDAFAGNWHGLYEEENFYTAQRVVVRLHQVSALAPTGWDNPGSEPYGWVHLWPPASRVQVGGPRFLHRVPAEPPQNGERVFVRLQAKPSELDAVRLLGEQAVADQKIAAFTVEILDQEARDVARQKVELATGGGLIDKALAEHVAGLPDHTDLERAAVLATARRFIAAAGDRSKV